MRMDNSRQKQGHIHKSCEFPVNSHKPSNLKVGTRMEEGKAAAQSEGTGLLKRTDSCRATPEQDEETQGRTVKHDRRRAEAL
jgi:hypothetical protein